LPSARGASSPSGRKRAVALAALLSLGTRRTIIGIAGPPGAGKSTLAQEIVTALNAEGSETAVVVPFDGFHLSNTVLRAYRRADRKGALDTFDLAGFRALVQRLRDNRDDVVYAPGYARDIEEAVAAAIPVPSRVRVVVVEGNYLLLPQTDLIAARAALEACWYLDVDGGLRLRRLADRHVATGKTPPEAWTWATGSDETNAALIRGTRQYADVIIRLVPAVASNAPGA
jgi:pantothenate kinase